ncbi:MAG: hypoxanthine phosphoribosyltransferase [Clostridia bacterium]|nr:hypoxanthine phosphoribosyltransferase [Clostridia bacterium]
MLEDIEEIFFSQEQIDEITSRIAEEISNDYKDKNLTLICVLKGSVMFMSDLMKKITIPCMIDFLAAESYGSSTKSSGEVKITKDISDDIRNRDVVIIEDILDSGRTLKKLTEFLNMKDPSSISICTLLDKPSRRAVDIEPRYVGSEVQDQFVVGYGLDYAQQYRNLPFIGILKKEAAERIANNNKV